MVNRINHQALLLRLSLNIRHALLDNAAGQENAVVIKLLRNILQQHDNNISNNIRYNHICLALSAVQQIALAHLNLLRQAVVCHILACHAHCHSINIYCLNRFCAQHSGSNRQNTAARAHVEHLSLRRNHLLQTLHHHIRRMVRASAKRHTRVNLDNMLALLGSIFLPARLDNQALAYMGNMEILLPFVRPVLLIHLAEARIAKAVFANALLDKLELLINLRQTLFQLLIICIISADRHHLGVLLLRNIAQLPGAAIAQIINQLRVLNRYALRANARQHICHSLYCLMRYRNIYFYPLHIRALLYFSIFILLYTKKAALFNISAFSFLEQ